MFDGDGMETLELQAKKLAEMGGGTNYGSKPCKLCGLTMNPVEYLYNSGRCTSCVTQVRQSRAQGKMA
jgi:hypothetical protein